MVLRFLNNIYEKSHCKDFNLNLTITKKIKETYRDGRKSS